MPLFFPKGKFSRISNAPCWFMCLNIGHMVPDYRIDASCLPDTESDLNVLSQRFICLLIIYHTHSCCSYVGNLLYTHRKTRNTKGNRTNRTKDNSDHLMPLWTTKWGTRQLGPRTTRTETCRPVIEHKSARKRGLVGPYVKTTRTV